MKLMKFVMVNKISMVVPLDNVSKRFLVGKRHPHAFEAGKAWREKFWLQLVHSDFSTVKQLSLIGVSMPWNLLMIFLCIFVED